jgi:hypothetical protein
MYFFLPPIPHIFSSTGVNRVINSVPFVFRAKKYALPLFPLHLNEEMLMQRTSVPFSRNLKFMKTNKLTCVVCVPLWYKMICI